MDESFKNATLKFLNAFEKVFDEDWNYTKEKLGVVEETEEQKENSRIAGLEIIYSVSPNGTFIHPKVDDEIEDWGYRGELLNIYRQLKEILKNQI